MTQMLVASLKLMSSRWRHIININHHQSSYRYSYNHHHWLSELLAGPAKGGAEVARGDGGQVDRVHWHHGQDRPSWCQWQSVDHYLYLIAMMRIKSQWWQCSHLFSAASVRLKQGWQASTFRDGKVQTWWSLYDDHDDDYDFYVIMTTIMITKFSSSSLPVLTKSSLSPHQVLSKSLTSINMFSPRLLPVKENFLNRPVFKVRLTNSLLDAPRESFLLSRVFTLSKATMGWVGGEIIHYNASLGMGTTISWMQCIQTHTTPATNKQNICIHKDKE